MCRGTGFNPQRCHHIEIMLSQKKFDVDLSQSHEEFRAHAWKIVIPILFSALKKTSHVV